MNKQKLLDALRAGKSYEDAAAEAGASITTAYRVGADAGIDMRAAFARRIIREGVPSRLPSDEAFCAWFSGFFDGEGCLGAWQRMQGDGKYKACCLTAQINQRDDSLAALTAIRDTLDCGEVYHDNRKRTATRPGSNPQGEWVCARVADQAEIIVPILDRWPLRTKKAAEYKIWRQLVMDKYTWTCGGRVRSLPVPDDAYKDFAAGVSAIRAIRTYSPQTVTMKEPRESGWGARVVA